MNGGRLSDDEAFFLGIQQFREELQGEGKADGLLQPLRMIAVRYPEEAEEMQTMLEASGGDLAGDTRERLETMLQKVEAQYQEDFAE